MSYNKWIGIGRLTSDPDCKYLPSGKAICMMRLAVGRGKDLPTDFINITAWEKLAETCANNLTKGRLILVEGRIQVDQSEKDGQKREYIKVVANAVRFLDKSSGTANQAVETTKKALEGQEELGDLNLDDLPF